MSIAERGHNQPPSHLEMTHDVIEALAVWLDQVPVVETHEEAKVAAELIKRANIAMKELDAERDGLVRPLNMKVKQVNGEYKLVSVPLARCAGEVKQRMIAFLRAEEARRGVAAREAREHAEAVQKAAQEAAGRAHEATENAAAGELGTGTAKAIAAAIDAAGEAAHAAHAADIAEKDVKTRVSTGFGSAIGLRNVENLVIDNHISAIMTMWPCTKLYDAILSAARDYRKEHGSLPKGISIQTERKL